ncbi:uncharacterized protein LOC118437148 [Folsomia candida]|uniref:Uncharacterized protein n=1 Tax=Folsomia candida TaxID=158441 RepID=A0A226DT52_FOLCA|nr:uncharacterized protein LOC118437148 [Folsomia candida]OXA48393.1 hypothetical protein Fcan01_17380 [Folsomia candida]
MPLHDPLQAVVATVVEIPPEEVQSSQTRLTLSTPPEPVIPIMLGLANHMKGTFPDWPCDKDIVRITPNPAGMPLDTRLLPLFDTNLRVRILGGSTCCCFSGSSERTVVMIGNMIRVDERLKFEEKLRFDYPKPGLIKNTEEKRIEFVSSNSSGPVGWIVTGKDVASEAKIGLTSDTEPSPRFTTKGHSIKGKSITILNPAGEAVAVGGITLSRIFRGHEHYKEFQIMLPHFGHSAMSEVERELIFAVLILWGITARDLMQRSNYVVALIMIPITLLVALGVVLLFVFKPW